MEYYNGILCISGTKLIRSADNPMGVMSKDCYDKLSQRSKINVVRRACNGTPALVEFNSLPDRYKKMVEKIHPDPQTAAATAPFIARIKTDPKAVEFYTSYRYADGKSLDQETITKYANEAAIYNALSVVVEDMRGARRSRNIPMGRVNNLGHIEKSVMEYALSCVDSVRGVMAFNTPTNIRSFERKFKKYLANGYGSLIHRGFGNPNRVLIRTEVARALLIKLCSQGNQHSAPSITEAYNLWAFPNGEPTLTARTVLNFMTENEEAITLFRNGKSAWANKFDKVVSRERPSIPLRLVNADDNDLDLYFRRHYYVKGSDGKPKQVKDNYYRPKLYVVMDASCDYILGYAYGHTITKSLIRDALRNAMNHIKQLTGSYYMWEQIVADRWGLGGDLREFFEGSGTFTPPTAGLARAKSIERAFGTEWHKVLRCYKNYAGHNITAKKRANPDYIASNIATNPKAEEAGAQIEEFITAMRSLPWRRTGQSRQEVWLERFKDHTANEGRAISEETYLMTFGDKHPWENTATNKGIEVTIGGTAHLYDIPEAVYRAVVGKSVQVQYDPSDLTRVLVTDGSRRFVAHTNRKVPMALGDMKEGDRARLSTLLEQKEAHKVDIINEDALYGELLEREGINAESLLQAGVLKKELVIDATKVVATKQTNNIYSLMK